jgi:hypothetical protein
MGTQFVYLHLTYICPYANDNVRTQAPQFLIQCTLATLCFGLEGWGKGGGLCRGDVLGASNIRLYESVCPFIVNSLHSSYVRACVNSDVHSMTSHSFQRITLSMLCGSCHMRDLCPVHVLQILNLIQTFQYPRYVLCFLKLRAVWLPAICVAHEKGTIEATEKRTQLFTIVTYGDQ